MILQWLLLAGCPFTQALLVSSPSAIKTSAVPCDAMAEDRWPSWLSAMRIDADAA